MQDNITKESMSSLGPQTLQEDEEEVDWKARCSTIQAALSKRQNWLPKACR